MKFELNRLPIRDKESILAEIRRVAQLVHAHVFSYKKFNKHSKVSYSTVLKRFGSWKNALTQAGLADR